MTMNSDEARKTVESLNAVGSPVERIVRPRAAFEAWISAPPYEREVERFGDSSAWPGNYRELDVDLAWCAWSAAMAATRERCAQIVEGVQGWGGTRETAARIRGA